MQLMTARSPFSCIIAAVYIRWAEMLSSAYAGCPLSPLATDRINPLPTINYQSRNPG